MIEIETYNPPISLIAHNQSNGYSELSRLMAAAVVNSTFCDLLLNNPELALKSGFQGENFCFTKEERDLILSIRADSLAGLANHLARSFDVHFHIRINPPAQPNVVFGY